jgi:hypothetical protein
MNFLHVVVVEDEKFPLVVKKYDGLELHSNLHSYNAELPAIPPQPTKCGETVALFRRRRDYHKSEDLLVIFDNRSGVELARILISADGGNIGWVQKVMGPSPLSPEECAFLRGVLYVLSSVSNPLNGLITFPSKMGRALDEWLDQNGLPAVWGYRLPLQESKPAQKKVFEEKDFNFRMDPDGFIRFNLPEGEEPTEELWKEAERFQKIYAEREGGYITTEQAEAAMVAEQMEVCESAGLPPPSSQLHKPRRRRNK